MDRLTYDEIGATRTGPLPTGYRHLTYRTYLGRGCMNSAADAVLGWRMHEAAGVRIRATAPRAQPGVALTCGLGFGPLRLSVPCLVVWTDLDDERAGFAYGTLPGHPFRGEESFVLTRTKEDDVWFTITAFSAPARWWVKVAGPITIPLQGAYARRSARALKRLIRQDQGRP